MFAKVKCFFKGHRWVAWYNAGYVCQRCATTIMGGYQMEPKDIIVPRVTE